MAEVDARVDDGDLDARPCSRCPSGRSADAADARGDDLRLRHSARRIRTSAATASAPTPAAAWSAKGAGEGADDKVGMDRLDLGIRGQAIGDGLRQPRGKSVHQRVAVQCGRTVLVDEGIAVHTRLQLYDKLAGDHLRHPWWHWQWRGPDELLRVGWAHP